MYRVLFVFFNLSTTPMHIIVYSAGLWSDGSYIRMTGFE